MALTPQLLRALQDIVGPAGLVVSAEGRLTYECDMHTFYKGTPDAVVLPESAAQVAAIVRLCRREHVPIVPRGSGTGLIGGAMAPEGGVMVSMTRMNRIVELDFENRCATVQPGLINLWLSQATRERGYFFAPDPSSQMVSSIGGNASTNAGGPHCLKYGITVNHVLGLEVVTGAGELVQLGGKTHERPGYDLTGVMVGAEGTLGLVTGVIVRLTHLPEGVKTILASFPTIEDASEAVSAIIRAGIIPAALEMLDEVVIRAIEEGVGAGYPKGAGAVLLIELDGPTAEIEAQSGPIEAICRDHLALEIRVAQSEAERALLWKGRKEAAGVFGRLTPNWLLQDAVVPRSKLPQIMKEVAAIGARHRLRHRQRVPRRRRQPPPADLLRRPCAGRARARQAGERGAARRVPAAGRQRDRRARGGTGQAGEPADAVRGRGSQLHGAAAARVRSRLHHESRQAAALASRLRRGVPARRAPAARRHLDLSVAVSAVAVHQALADIAGREHCLGATSELTRFAIDGMIPSLVVRPGSADEVSRVVTLCAAERLAMAPRGAGIEPGARQSAAPARRGARSRPDARGARVRAGGHGGDGGGGRDAGPARGATSPRTARR